MNSELVLITNYFDWPILRPRGLKIGQPNKQNPYKKNSYKKNSIKETNNAK